MEANTGTTPATTHGGFTLNPARDHLLSQMHPGEIVIERAAELLGGDYIFSLKPNPIPLAMASFNADQVRAELRRAFRLTRGCHLEVIMKDNHTIRGDPRRVVHWVQLCREEAEHP